MEFVTIASVASAICGEPSGYPDVYVRRPSPVAKSIHVTAREGGGKPRRIGVKGDQGIMARAGASPAPTIPEGAC